MYLLANIFVGCLADIWTLVIDLPYFSPARWPDQNRYLAYWLPKAPLYLVAFGMVAVAIALLRTMEWEWVLRLRILFIAMVITRLIALAVDIVMFSNLVFRETLALIMELALLAYLFRSERVRRVFLTKDWPDPNTASHLDLAPRKGIVYTPSEHEAMRARQQQNQ